MEAAAGSDDIANEGYADLSCNPLPQCHADEPAGIPAEAVDFLGGDGMGVVDQIGFAFSFIPVVKYDRFAIPKCG